MKNIILIGAYLTLGSLVGLAIGTRTNNRSEQQSSHYCISQVPEVSKPNQDKLLASDIEPYIYSLNDSTVILELNGILFKVPLLSLEDYTNSGFPVSE